ncbi:hypothetical protein [Streptomyces achromogenes]|uniref:hypothetical protein n=1 Tax=Streptomyces achromogenes TaxID=67255 RepID=UPI0036BAD021
MQEQRPRCPRPPGEPRWVAMFREPGGDTWTVGAQSPYREPVLYAVGDMSRTLRARGDEVTVALWGPGDGGNGAWRLFGTPSAATRAPAPEPSAPPASPEPERLAERMTDRRLQVLLAGLDRAGLYDLGPQDQEAVRVLADRLDEPTARRVAHWLAAAAGRP